MATTKKNAVPNTKDHKKRGIIVEESNNPLTPPPETHGAEAIRSAAQALEPSGRDADQKEVAAEKAVTVVQPENPLKGE